MPKVSNRAIDLMEIALSAGSPQESGRRFFRALIPYGAKAIFARAYVSPSLTGPAQIFSRISPPGWESFVDQERYRSANYVVREMRRRASPFAWSDVPKLSSLEKEIEQFTADNGYGDGLAIPCHGPGGYVGLVSVAFEALHNIDPADQLAIQIASLVLHDRMRTLAVSDSNVPKLSSRERDCLSFISEGLSDSQIADVLGISLSTVITHVKNARMKLGAKTRAQAVARFVFTAF